MNVMAAIMATTKIDVAELIAMRFSLDAERAGALLSHPGEYVRAWTVRLLGDEGRVSTPLTRRLEALAASEPRPTNVPPTRRSGASIQARWIAAAASVSIHITIRQVVQKAPRAAIRKTGVAVPAIRKKIIRWSRRCRRRLQAGVQVPR